MTIDPLSFVEVGPCRLPAGACVEGAAVALNEAEVAGAEQVTVRVVEPDGWIALKRVSVSDLRGAIDRNSAC